MFLQTCRQFFVGFKNVSNNWYFHEITPLSRFHALDIEFPSRAYGVPLFFSTERARCRKTFLPSGRKDLSASRTLEREGDFFGLQHSPFPIRSCRKSLERDGQCFRNDVRQSAVPCAYLQQTVQGMPFHLLANDG